MTQMVIQTVTTKMKMKTFWWRYQQWSQSDSQNHYQCQSGSSNEKTASFVQCWCQQNHWASYTRKKCNQKIKLLNWPSHGDQQHQANIWRAPNIKWSLESTPQRFLQKMPKSYLQRIHQYQYMKCIWCFLQWTGMDLVFTKTSHRFPVFPQDTSRMYEGPGINHGESSWASMLCLSL